eukprot:tig00021432_g21211.t1
MAVVEKKQTMQYTNDCHELLQEDPYLGGHQGYLKWRMDMFKDFKRRIDEHEGGIEKFTRGYEKFGFNRRNGYIEYREWAPGARSLSIMGDFNGWNRDSHKCERDQFGCWSIRIPDKADGSPAIAHGSKVKCHLVLANGEHGDRIPAWIKRVVQDPSKSILFDGVYWDPPQPYKWKAPRPPKPEHVRIYEAHVGMGTTECKVGTYVEFRDYVLPRVKALGYTCVQLMAIMEHAYYASFGYHVTNFFAISSRCGTPEELKSLIDRAHELGLYVLMDVVHSHASNNVLDGINSFDGTDHQYFHEGGRGRHDLWDSRLFNYGHWEVSRFLLSNLRWYLEEYKFDGFRFDGVTSMLYKHHGLAYAFSGGYHEYFGDNTDVESCVYLMLANDMVHELYPDAVTIAEDVSGMPTLCRPVQIGGMGFDYRLALAIPDMWIKLLKEYKDDHWDMGHIVHTLTNRRWREKTVGYCESHDQALVGDKTIAFWLMDKEMYWHMSTTQPLTPIIDRGMSLHKMIRLLTIALGGEGYLGFMGNEFGHPEWIDFPRAGNGNSYHHARRRWDLAEADHLRYKFLDAFERGMHRLDAAFKFMTAQNFVSLKHEGDKVISFEHTSPCRLVWAFNFHPTQSYTGYRIGCSWKGTYRIILDTDAPEYGGHSRNDPKTKFVAGDGWNNRAHSIQIYLPSRSAIVFCLEEDYKAIDLNSVVGTQVKFDQPAAKVPSA